MHDLSPCVTFSPTENSYICKYLANEDILDSNMTVESQIKLRAYFIVEDFYLFAIWAQQSKAAERVLDTQLQPFQTMHVYYFLAMVYSFLGSGLLNDCFMVMYSIICVHIIICRHNARSRINCSQLGVNIKVTDRAVISWRVIAMFLFWHAWLQSLCCYGVVSHTSKSLRGLISGIFCSSGDGTISVRGLPARRSL